MVPVMARGVSDGLRSFVELAFEECSCRKKYDVSTLCYIFVLFAVAVPLLLRLPPSFRRQRPYRLAGPTASWTAGGRESFFYYRGVIQAMTRQHPVTLLSTHLY